MSNKIIAEWKTEIDELKFEHYGLKCMIKRVEHLGHLCGYVGSEKEISNDVLQSIDVHGGVTFDMNPEYCKDIFDDYFEGCKMVVGFDTAHSRDLSPYLYENGMKSYGTYRNFEYMRNETMKLAEQVL